MASARLIRKRWCSRTFSLECDGGTSVVHYSPWGMNRESVSVDGVVVVRRPGTIRMSHGYRFRIGAASVELSVGVPWWGELFPLYLSFVRLEVDGDVVYEEGRPPRRPLDWTTAAEGFAVIPVADGKHSA
jgi:hypothetical protein